MKKKIAILGSTGAIGKQTLEVIEKNQDYFSAEILVAGNNSDLLIGQAKKYKPKLVIIQNEKKLESLFLLESTNYK